MRSSKRNWIVAVLFLVLGGISLKGQEPQEIFDYMAEGDYIVGGVSVSGVRYLDVNALIALSGLRAGRRSRFPVMRLLSLSSVCGSRDYSRMSGYRLFHSKAILHF